MGKGKTHITFRPKTIWIIWMRKKAEITTTKPIAPLVRSLVAFSTLAASPALVIKAKPERMSLPKNTSPAVTIANGIIL